MDWTTPSSWHRVLNAAMIRMKDGTIKPTTHCIGMVYSLNHEAASHMVCDRTTGKFARLQVNDRGQIHIRAVPTG